MIRIEKCIITAFNIFASVEFLKAVVEVHFKNTWEVPVLLITVTIKKKKQTSFPCHICIKQETYILHNNIDVAFT